MVLHVGTRVGRGKEHQGMPFSESLSNQLAFGQFPVQPRMISISGSRENNLVAPEDNI